MILGQALPPRVDVILVHGCPARSDGSPSTCNQRRARAAVSAWRRGLAPKVLFTGGPVINRWAESEVTARYAQAIGLPASAILTERESRHTVTNLSVGKGIMKRLGMRTALQVSEAMHLVWAKQLAEFYRMKTWLYPADPLPPYTDRYLRTGAFDEYEPWTAQTGAYGRPGAVKTAVALTAGARRVAYIAVPDFGGQAGWRELMAAISALPGAELQQVRWSSYASLQENARQLSLFVDGWTRGYNGEVDEVMVVGFGWGGVIARAAAALVQGTKEVPVRVLLVDAPLRGSGQYQRDWSRTPAPLRWVMLGKIDAYDPPGPNVTLEEVRDLPASSGARFRVGLPSDSGLPPGPCNVTLALYSGNGSILVSREVTVSPGQTVSLDFPAGSMVPGVRRRMWAKTSSDGRTQGWE